MTASHDTTDDGRIELSKEADHLFSAIQVQWPRTCRKLFRTKGGWGIKVITAHFIWGQSSASYLLLDMVVTIINMAYRKIGNYGIPSRIFNLTHLMD